MKSYFSFYLGSLSLFASTASVGENPDLTMTWGWFCLIYFVVGYYFVAAEGKICNRQKTCVIYWNIYVHISLRFIM